MKTTLLHNMSAPPKTTITFNGLDGSPLIPDPKKAGVSVARNRLHSGIGIPIKFVWKGSSDPEKALLQLSRAPGDNPRATLTKLIDAKAKVLALPDGVAVIPFRDSYEEPWWQDELAALAVLTKSSQSVWLRSKSCSLSALKQRHRVALLIPAHAIACITELYRK